ncbi:hypothetical protein B591_30613 (plasmid) [Streptomyces sp. GBA 94-10 4N24]|uniref:hypothetical protein n=1 Tax=Streptomyces sp. GBA 94-10 4N24 TaxID=1218177 RepID=UPI0003C2F7C3|nr:hypothetical protein [Streptomyces sp. GBA 94-10 4N24]ESP95642.1 hypothetical protein B591_30613 [Streptomyces sp. GBA 94-10 4N24]UZN63104.1 hypothetical protein B591N_30613 [Streptomyces sp. GBA 94-10 4N24]
MARKPGTPRPTSAVAVINPKAPAADKDLLRTAQRNPEALDRLPDLGAPTHKGRLALGAVTTGGAGAFWAFLSHGDSGAGEQQNPGGLLAKGQEFFAVVQDLAGLAALGAGLATAAYAILLVAGRVHERRLTERYWRASREHFIAPKELTDECCLLLARGQQATTTVMRSHVHRHGLIDKAHNEVALPGHEWELATILRDYSRLAEAEPRKPAGGEVVTLLQKRRDALRASLDGVERRVAALEAYADRVVEADRQWEEWRQIEELSEGADAVLDLLARTTRDDMAVAEIEGMADQAAVVAEALTNAVESAKKAAVIALPPPAATA